MMSKMTSFSRLSNSYLIILYPCWYAHGHNVYCRKFFIAVSLHYITHYWKDRPYLPQSTSVLEELNQSFIPPRQALDAFFQPAHNFSHEHVVDNPF